MSRTKAFTLIELLVVISVIAMLMTVMIPTLGKARKQATFVVCKNNLRNYGLSGVMYLSDNNECFPDSYTWLHADGNKAIVDPCAWHDANYLADGVLWPYLEAKDVHMCPTFFRLAKRLGASHSGHDESIAINPQYSYSMNSFLGDGIWGRFEKVSEIKHPAEIIFFSEENIWPIDGLSVYVLNNNNLYMLQISGSELYNNIATYHKTKGSDLNSGVANIAFVDGHVDIGSAWDGYKLAMPQ